MAKKQKKERKPSKTQQLQAEVEQLKADKAKLQETLDTIGTALLELLLAGGLEDTISDMVSEEVDSASSSGFCCHY